MIEANYFWAEVLTGDLVTCLNLISMILRSTFSTSGKESFWNTFGWHARCYSDL
jgi:hypothetical protein